MNFVLAIVLAILAKNVSHLNAQAIEATAGEPLVYQENEVIRECVCDFCFLHC